MQISLKWVNELVNIETVNLNYLIEKLTLGGFEVEDILEIQINNQKIITLDISATANRSDSLSIQGISQEIATLLNKPVKKSTYSIATLDWKRNITKFSSSFLNLKNVAIFNAITVTNITNFSTPKWVQQKLVSSGLPIENNLLDLKNYILLETGYPFEFYDLDKIYSKLDKPEFELTLTKNNINKKFIGNNGNIYQLDNSILTLNADKLVLGIAGIIPNIDFCYSNETKALLIEASIFNSAAIRQQSRLLGVRTDRSARYEKSLKNISLLEALYRLIYILRVSNPSLICKLHTFNQTESKSTKSIILNYQTIKEILGPVKLYKNSNYVYITTRMVNNYLNHLKFFYKYNKQKLSWKVIIPYSRSEDITREIDLVEEIGRLHGFNNFLTRLPTVKKIGTEDDSYQTRKKITSYFLNLGFSELIHYSLVNQETFIKNQVKLVNSSLVDYSSLRSSLLPNLILTVHENLKQGNSPIEGFEYGHIFSKNKNKDFYEKENIAGVFGGIKTKQNWSDKTKSLSWFEGKGKIEQLFKQLNIVTNWKSFTSIDCKELFHPYRTAEIFLSNELKLGIFGQIHPIVAKDLNLSPDLYLFEFDLKLIKQTIQEKNLSMYKEYTLYPKVIKDLSFIIHKNISFEEIKNLLYINGSKFLTHINLIDEYNGPSVPDKHISLCLQLTFQSNNKTLQNKELEKILTHLRSLLINKFNVVIRA